MVAIANEHVPINGLSLKGIPFYSRGKMVETLQLVLIYDKS